MVNFFKSNNLVNNPDKAAILFNCKGKGEFITVDNVGGENLKSTYSEKLLGLHINSDFNWSSHIEKICIDLKKRTGLLRRIRYRIPKEKLVMIAEAIFNSKIRYGVAVYLNPVYEEEDLKMRKIPKNTSVLQTLQNNMIRVILGLKKEKHVNMAHIRKKIQMMSVNQMCVYHTILEAYNIMRNSASEQIQMKWSNKTETNYSLRSAARNDLKVPEKPMPRCLGFTYNGSKLFNILPRNLRENQNPHSFKTLTKEWIWNNIPSH